MPRPKVGVQNEQKLDQRRVKDQSPKKENQKSKQQEETLVEKVKQADIENGAVPTISDRSETSLVWMVNLNQGLALKRSKGQMMSMLPSNEKIDTYTWSTPISEMVLQHLKQSKWEDNLIYLAVLLSYNVLSDSENSDFTFKLE